MSAYTVHTAWIGWITVLLWENHLQFHLCAHVALRPRCAAQQVGARPLQRGGGMASRKARGYFTLWATATDSGELWFTATWSACLTDEPMKNSRNQLLSTQCSLARHRALCRGSATSPAAVPACPAELTEHSHARFKGNLAYLGRKKWLMVNSELNCEHKIEFPSWMTVCVSVSSCVTHQLHLACSLQSR